MWIKMKENYLDHCQRILDHFVKITVEKGGWRAQRTTQVSTHES